MSESKALDAVVLHRIRVPLRRAVWAAHGEESIRELVLVEARFADGVVGWGECAALSRPTYTGEHVDGAWLVLRDHLVPAALAGRPHDVVGHPMAVTAVDGALADAALRRAGRSLVDSVASRLGRPRDALERTVVLGRADHEELVARVGEQIRVGVAAVKLKVSGRPEDLAAVEVVRSTHPGLPLAVDANGSLDRRALARLDDLGLLYIEQPAPADDPVLSATWARSCRTPIALDESIGSPAAVEATAALGAGAIVNVKPARLGGTGPAVEAILRARDLGLGVFVGGMLESGVGRATALALAASSACTLPTDLGPTSLDPDLDPSEPAIALDDHGRVVLPRGSGIGVAPRVDRLEAVTVDRFVAG